MAPENFTQRFKYSQGEVDNFFNHPVWQEVRRMMYTNIKAGQGVLETSNPADPGGVAKVLRAQGEVAISKIIYGLRDDIVLHCVAKDEPTRAETERRLEQWKRLSMAQTPPEPEHK